MRPYTGDRTATPCPIHPLRTALGATEGRALVRPRDTRGGQRRLQEKRNHPGY